jgi:signal peptidase I
MANSPSAPVTSEASHYDHASKPKRRVLAAAISAVLPGTGQLWLGNRQAEIGFLSAFCLLLLLYWPLRLPRSFAGVEILLIAGTAVFLGATWHALRMRREQATKGSRWWLVLLVPLSLAGSLGHSNWLLVAAGFRPFDVPSSGMKKTILQGDRVIVDFRRYRVSAPKRRDIVIFHKDGMFFVKRVEAVGGDTIEGEGGVIFVNHQRQEEPYVQHLGGAPVELDNFGPLKIPVGGLFLMGDNRDISRDSRTVDFGLVAEGSVTAQVLYIIRSKRERVGTDLR